MTRRRIGIVGAGQLARMTALAAAALDVAVTVLSPSAADPAAGPASHQRGAPDSLEDLRALAAAADVVTFDHERIPHTHLQALAAEGVNVQPPPAAKLLAQDKALQREVLGRQLGVCVPENRLVRSLLDLDQFASATGWPVVLKARSGGYDGRGVSVAPTRAHAAAVLAAADARGSEVLAERFLDIRAELSVLVVRSTAGETVVYPVIETMQHAGMCREAAAPARIDPAVASAARSLAVRIAEDIGATGVLAVELFLTGGGLVLNELALRPHNSGHLTLGGCMTSQFENHVRAVLGMPLGAVDLLAPAAAMVNVVGGADGSDPRARLPRALAVPGALVHLYGKEPRPRRKLGHVTGLGASIGDARRRAWGAARELEGVAA